jgi:hypothetical protein
MSFVTRQVLIDSSLRPQPLARKKLLVTVIAVVKKNASDRNYNQGVFSWSIPIPAAK